MPEYLAPGVYVEEVSFRSKSIEGVPTSTTGFAGMTRYGPVQYPGGPATTEPRLIAGFTEFERIYGGLEPLRVGAGGTDERTAYTAHAARAFFDNGGRRLYLSRVFTPREPAPGTFDYGIAGSAVSVGTETAAWRARWPGSFGNVLVETRTVRSKNVAYVHPTFGLQAKRAKLGAVVEIFAAGATPLSGNAPLVLGNLALVEVDAGGQQTFHRGGAALTLNPTDVIQLVELQVVVQVDSDRVDVYDELGADPRQKGSLILAVSAATSCGQN